MHRTAGPVFPKGTRFSVTPQVAFIPDNLALFAPYDPAFFLVPSLVIGAHIPHHTHKYIRNAATTYLTFRKKPHIDVTHFPRQGKGISKMQCIGVFYTFLYEWNFFNVVSLSSGCIIGYRVLSSVWMDDWNSTQSSISFFEKQRFEIGGPAIRVGIGYKHVMVTLQAELFFGKYNCGERFYGYDTPTGTWVSRWPDTDYFFGTGNRENASRSFSGFSITPQLDLGIQLLW